MHRLALAGLLPALVAVPGVAQSPPVITEAEFLSVLDASHPAVAERAQILAVARARVVDASTFENPVFEWMREDPSGPVEQTDWTISWQLPPRSRRPEVEARREAFAAVAARLSHELLALRLAMREVFARWALAVARQERLSAQAHRVEALARREAARAERGESSGLETHRLELAATALRARVSLAAAATERARAEAAAWFPALLADARPAVPELPPPLDLATVHPLVSAAEAGLAAAILEREAAGRFLASPALSVGWQRQKAGSEALDGSLVGIAWSVPVFDRKRAQRVAAEARVAGARARLERVRREIDSARPAALAAFERLAAALAVAMDDLAGNERMLDGAEAAFRLGETSLTDLLETHRSVTEAELTVLDLHEAALAAHRDLERLTGPGARPGQPLLPYLQENLP